MRFRSTRPRPAPWSPDLDDQLRGMIADNLSWAIIADMMERTETAIMIRASRLGLTRPTFQDQRG